MKDKEFRERAGKILGIKTAVVTFAWVVVKNTNHLEQQVQLIIIPNRIQAKKLLALGLEFGVLKEA